MKVAAAKVSFFELLFLHHSVVLVLGYSKYKPVSKKKKKKSPSYRAGCAPPEKIMP
jgi:hypothetical protein